MQSYDMRLVRGVRVACSDKNAGRGWFLIGLPVGDLPAPWSAGARVTKCRKLSHVARVVS